MDKRIGVWLDHERALIVAITSYGLIMERIASEAGKRTRLAGGSRSRTPYGPQEVADEPSRDARYQQRLRRYYDKVVHMIKDAEEIYICGPGKAKLELRKVLERYPSLQTRVRAVKPADKMTEKQFVAHVKEVFEQPRQRAHKSQT